MGNIRCQERSVESMGFVTGKTLCYNSVSRSTFYLFYVQLIEDIALYLKLHSSFLLFIATSCIEIHMVIYSLHWNSQVIYTCVCFFLLLWLNLHCFWAAKKDFIWCTFTKLKSDQMWEMTHWLNLLARRRWLPLRMTLDPNGQGSVIKILTFNWISNFICCENNTFFINEWSVKTSNWDWPWYGYQILILIFK